MNLDRDIMRMSKQVIQKGLVSMPHGQTDQKIKQYSQSKRGYSV